MYKIVVVEDERLESDAICKMIEDSQNNWKIVATAESGTEALEKIEETNPDIILLDINLPELSGLDVLRKVKKDDPYKRVIIVTAFNEFEFAHKAIKYRVDDFLLKPIRPQQLYDAINLVGTTIKDSSNEEFDVKMKNVLFHVNNQSYKKSREALQEYIEILFTRCDKDINTIQGEIQNFLHHLNDTVQAMVNRPMPNINKLIKIGPNAYNSRYSLYMELKVAIDLIFDILLESEKEKRNTMEGILNYIDRNCHKDISLNQVGEYANMSSYYLSKIFKKETGVNFVTYLTDRKIELAKDMLVNTDIPIINIALELSYHEPNYFSKVFKKSTGLTPTEYRKQKRKDY